jgi:putative N6-adenine-specific DNA methylase
MERAESRTSDDADAARPVTRRRMFATCAPGIEDVLERELKRLALPLHARVKGGVFFDASDEEVWRACLELRTASRIHRILLAADAKTEKQVEDALLGLDLAPLLRKGQGIGIELHDSSKPVKQVAATANSIERKLNRKLNAREAMAKDMKDYVRLVVHRRRGELRIGVDLAGKALHKRGWRNDRHDAPIQETLAAALVMLTGYDGSNPFVDPFCGSGTIAIEAAYLALGKAPLVHRKKGEFAFERFVDFEPRRYRRVLESVRAARRTAPAAPIVASDLEEKRLGLARKNAEAARVGHQMRFLVADARFPAHRLSPGTIVANLPYGVRLSTPEEVRSLCRSFARTMTSHYADWKGILLVADDGCASDLEALADDRRPVKNGTIDCLALIFGA